MSCHGAIKPSVLLHLLASSSTQRRGLPTVAPRGPAHQSLQRIIFNLMVPESVINPSGNRDIARGKPFGQLCPYEHGNTGKGSDIFSIQAPSSQARVVVIDLSAARHLSAARQPQVVFGCGISAVASQRSHLSAPAVASQGSGSSRTARLLGVEVPRPMVP